MYLFFTTNAICQGIDASLGTLKSEDKMFSCRRHTVNFCSEMAQAKHVSEKNIFFSMNVDKIKGKRIFEIVHCPYKMQPN